MTNDLTTITQQEFSIDSYVNNLEGKLKFAHMLIGTQMCPAHFKTPPQVLSAILYGTEIGFSPMQSLQCINVINGRPTIDASGIKAKILGAGGTLKTVKWTESECTLACSRGEWVETFTFSTDDAKKMGLLSKDNWIKMPKQMLYARCVSTLGRNMYADLLKGFYGKEEMLDSIEVSNEKPREFARPIEQEKPKEPKYYYYSIPDLSDTQSIWMQDQGANYDQDRGVWVSTKDLGGKLAKYKTEMPAQAELIDASKVAKDLKHALGDLIEVETVKMSDKEAA